MRLSFEPHLIDLKDMKLDAYKKRLGYCKPKKSEVMWILLEDYLDESSRSLYCREVPLTAAKAIIGRLRLLLGNKLHCPSIIYSSDHKLQRHIKVIFSNLMLEVYCYSNGSIALTNLGKRLEYMGIHEVHIDNMIQHIADHYYNLIKGDDNV